MPEPLSLDEVRHIAALARLRLTDAQLKACRHDLTSILEYVARLRELDLDEVEPMAHPHSLTTRLDDDEPQPTMAREDVLRNAPAAEGPFFAVPKVLAEGGGE